MESRAGRVVNEPLAKPAQGLLATDAQSLREVHDEITRWIVCHTI
jgi:hypothetical protein